MSNATEGLYTDVYEFIDRARSALGESRSSRGLLPVRYSQERKPFEPHSDEVPDWLDCSKFVCWAARIARLDTKGFVEDALGPRRWVDRLSEPRVGCLVVYPDYVAQPLVNGVRSSTHDGHMGIVTEVDQKLPSKVLHCSKMVELLRQSMAPGAPQDAVIESGPAWITTFHPIYAWCKNITSHP
jgi:hypothetical protein